MSVIKHCFFAKSFSRFNQKDINIKDHACLNNISYSDGSIWTKHNKNLFDFTVESVIGAEVCDLIGLFSLHSLQQVLHPDTYGLYRDGGMVVLDNFSKCDQE